jgi:hypothetical protein
MNPTTFDQMIQIVNLGLVPVALIYGAHKGWITTGRELSMLEQRYEDLQVRYDRMEHRLQEQQDELRQELGETRQMLIDYLARSSKEG